ncbi:SanA/YdcF family protein [Streptomyces xanthochromogenes]|uniref:SanA/YdcF family protein n=1 Tax=Streptomyces xanthochromogenes TaxID=67384 RepID=UPI001673DDFF|nr:ElyC/SanA/YdcF family protein [Streptomyces xanthochromogenes]
MQRIRWKRPRPPRTRTGRRRLVQGLVAGCVLALAPATWLYTSTGGRVGTVADAPAAGVAVVFGAGLRDGQPSPYLAGRLDAAVRLYRAGKVKAVLVTGDNSRPTYDEPDAMRGYLVRHGVPDKSVVSDFAGFDTWDSCVRAKKVFGVDRAVLVSQGFHIRRAVALCEAAGVRSYGVGVDAPHDVTWYYGGTREIFAAGKALLDAVFRPDPTFLGPKEPGVTRALAAAG